MRLTPIWVSLNLLWFFRDMYWIDYIYFEWGYDFTKQLKELNRNQDTTLDSSTGPLLFEILGISKSWHYIIHEFLFFIPAGHIQLKFYLWGLIKNVWKEYLKYSFVLWSFLSLPPRTWFQTLGVGGEYLGHNDSYIWDYPVGERWWLQQLLLKINP